MKDWNKLTYEELNNLSDEQIEFYKKLLYAQNGVRFPERPKEIDTVNIPKDKTIYIVEHLGSSYSGISFGSLEEAKKVVDVLKTCKSLGHIESKTDKYFELGTPKDYYGKHIDFNIKTEEVYSKEKYLEVQETLNTYKKLREQYNKDKEEYDKIYSKAIEVTQEFIDKLEKARELISHRQRLFNKYYFDYLPLADNNSKIAMGFLKKAYTVSEEDEYYINKHKEDYIKEKQSCANRH